MHIWLKPCAMYFGPYLLYQTLVTWLTCSFCFLTMTLLYQAVAVFYRVWWPPMLSLFIICFDWGATLDRQACRRSSLDSARATCLFRLLGRWVSSTMLNHKSYLMFCRIGLCSYIYNDAALQLYVIPPYHILPKFNGLFWLAFTALKLKSSSLIGFSLMFMFFSVWTINHGQILCLSNHSSSNSISQFLETRSVLLMQLADWSRD